MISDSTKLIWFRLTQLGRSHDELQNSNVMLRYNKRNDNLLKCIKNTTRSGNLSEIINTEKSILQYEFANFITSELMADSYNKALKEIHILQDQIQILSDKKLYEIVARGYQRSANQKDGLPLDEGRQILNSHLARLNNLDKAKLVVSDKEVIEARREAWIVARKAYIELQQQNYENKSDPNAHLKEMAALGLSYPEKFWTPVENEKPAKVNTDSPFFKRLIQAQRDERDENTEVNPKNNFRPG